MVKAKCITIFKNEADILEDWIRYHLAIFGDGNVHVINDHSTDDSFSILERYKGRITVEPTIVADSNYKSENLSRVMARYRDECDLLIPIDADEFISLQNSSDPAEIRAEFNKLDPKAYGRFKFHFNYNAVPKTEEPPDPLISLRDFQITSFEFLGGVHHELGKSFYAADTFVVTDAGNHQGLTLNERTCYTNLWLITFPIRSRQQFEEKLIKGALHQNFWKRYPTASWHWRQGYDALRSGRFEEHYVFWANQQPHTRRSFFADQIEKLRKPQLPAATPEPDSATLGFMELAQLCTSLSDLLSNWVCPRPASHFCFDLPDLEQPPWLKLADDADAIVRYGMLRRYNPARFMQLSSPSVLRGVDEAISATQLRTQPLTPLSSAVPTLARTLKTGDFISLNSVSELTELLPKLTASVVVEIRQPDAPLPPGVEPLIPTTELTDSKSWELLYQTAWIAKPPAAPRSLWLRVNP